MALTEALISEGPASDARELMLYGQFVGEWEFDWTEYDDGGAVRAAARGDWIFGWVLEGRAVQDVWIVPGREYGTTLRVYDPRTGTWKVTWNGPIQGTRASFVARVSGGEIVQEGVSAEGQPLRWIFSDIRDDSFRWRAVYSVDGGRSWRLRTEMNVQRNPAQGSLSQLAGRASSHGAAPA